MAKILIDEIIQAMASEEPIDESLLPNTPVAEGEKVLGDLPEYLRGFFAFRNQLRNKMQTLRAEHDTKCGTEAYAGEAGKKLHDQEHRAINQLIMRFNLVDSLFWTSVSDQFYFPRTHVIGLREGWKVVSIPNPNSVFSQSIEIKVVGGEKGLLSQLFGGLFSRS